MYKQTVLKLQTIKRSLRHITLAVLFGALGQFSCDDYRSGLWKI